MLVTVSVRASMVDAMRQGEARMGWNRVRAGRGPWGWRGAVLRLAVLLASVTAGGQAWAQAASTDVPGTPEQASQDAEQLQQQARERFLQGKAAYQQGDFELALEHFQAAYRLADLRARVFLLVNMAQALDRLDRAQEALRYYEQYLQLAPEGPNAGVVRGRVRVLRQRLAAREQEAAHASARQQEAEGTSARGLEGAPHEARDEQGGAWWPWAVGAGVALVAGAVVAGVLLGGGAEQPSVPAGVDVQGTLVTLR